jgi:hypothetical protein
MAKKNVGRLAGLAALAGAAYMMSRGKDKDATGPSATADEEKSSKARTAAQKDAVSGNRVAKDESFKPTNESAYASRSNMTPMQGVGDAKNDPLPKPKPKVEAQVDKDVKPRKSVSEPSDKSVTLAPENRDLEASTSRGTRTPAKPVSTVSSSEAGMKDYKPRRTPAASSTAKSTVSSSAEGMKNYVPRKPIYRQETQQERAERYVAKRRAAQDAGMKRGGAVKMASGGMTASRRADGIATKGKTRGKIC